MGNDYDVRFRKLSGYGEDLASQLVKWSTALSGTMDKVDVLIATEQASGETADRMRHYFMEAHSNVIVCIQTLLQSIDAEWVQYFAGYWKDIDTHVDAKIDTAHINSLKKSMTGFCTESQGFDARVKAILEDIDDIYTPCKSPLVTDEGVYKTIETNINELCNAIDANEQKYLSAVTSKLVPLADAILQTIQGYYSQNAMYKSTYTGSGNNPAYNSMLEKTIAMEGDLANNQEKIENARSGVEKHAQELAKYDFEIEQKRLEEERKKREEQVKWVKFGVAVISAGVTIGVTVATGGVGTAFIVGTIASSGVMGAVEGGVNEWGEQYIENGWEGMDWSRIGRGALVGGGKGLVTGAISAGVGAGFDKIGKAGFIAKAGDSSSFLIKHGSKMGMKMLEGTTEDVVTGIATRYVDNAYNAWIDDSSQSLDFKAGVQKAFDKTEIGKDAIVSLVENGTSYIANEGFKSRAGLGDITRNTDITPGMVGTYATIDAGTKFTSGIFKRGTETYIDSRLEGKGVLESMGDAFGSAADGREVAKDLISGTASGATKPMVTRNEKQKEYEDSVADQMQRHGEMEGASQDEIDAKIEAQLKKERADWKQNLKDQKSMRKNMNRKDGTATANSDSELKIINEMRESGEWDVEDDPNEKVRKNVNSGNYAHERKQLDEMRANGELDDTASGGAKKVPTMANAYEMADDPNLFKENQAGDITYGETEDGKVAYGSLKYTEDPERSQYAQRTAGGDERRPDDHGGHLIAAGEGGDPDGKNLVAMNEDLNTGRYKKQEMKEIDALKDGSKVYKYVETYGTGGSERPDTVMGYTITETPDGKREVEYFHTVNESAETLDEWDKIASSVPDETPEGMTTAEYHGMSEKDYNELQEILAEEEGY